MGSRNLFKPQKACESLTNDVDNSQQIRVIDSGSSKSDKSAQSEKNGKNSQEPELKSQSSNEEGEGQIQEVKVESTTNL